MSLADPAGKGQSNAGASAASPLQTALDLRAVVARLIRQLREAGADDAITPSQASALARLGKGGMFTVSALAAAEKVRPQSMAATIESLEATGLLSRSPDPHDGRRQLIELTETGRARVEGQKEAAAAWLENALATLEPDELGTIAAAAALLDGLLA